MCSSSTPKADPEDMLIKISVHNRGPEPAQIHVLPTLWFRNTWSWEEDAAKANDCVRRAGRSDCWLLTQLGDYVLSVRVATELLFTENETNANRLWGQPNPTPYVKDAFHEYVISRQRRCGKSGQVGNQGCRPLCASKFRPAAVKGSAVAAERESPRPTHSVQFDKIFAARLADANEFYDRITPDNLSEDERRVHRQALAGMMWSKQYYYFDLDKWLHGARLLIP